MFIGRLPAPLCASTRRLLKAFLWATSSAVVASPVSAAPSRAPSFEVRKAPCKGFILQDRKWTPLPELPFKVGDAILGRPVKSRSDIVYWSKDGNDYTVPVKCLSVVGRGSTPQSSKKSPTEAASPGRKPPASRMSWNLQLSGLSVNETLVLATSDSRSSSLQGGHFGGCIGGGVRLPLGRSFEFTGDACGLYLTGALSNVAGSDLNYEVSGASVFGLLTRFGAHWHNASNLFSVGLAAPLAYRVGNWPVPPSDSGVRYALTGTSAFQTGVLIETRVSPGKFLVLPRFGILGSPTNFLWEIGFGYSL